MNSVELVREIREYCRANSNEANVLKYSRYFKGGFDAYGLANGLLEKKVSEMLADPSITMRMILQAAPELVISEKYEETGFAAMMVHARREDYSREVFNAVETWFALGIRNWAHADILAMLVLPEFVNRQVVVLEDFQPWLRSEFKFQRRCVPVTLIKSIKNHPDLDQLIRMTEPLMSDPDREVHQGQGWFLREAWKVNRELTENFLYEYRNSAPRLIIQYATEKMTKDERLRFRKDK